MPRLIDPKSDRPLYRQIADQLRTAIREGRYAEGTPLPSETQLAEMYDVTRMTARQAVDLLKNEGLVRSEHGRGVFVRQRPTVHRLARNRFTRRRRESVASFVWWKRGRTRAPVGASYAAVVTVWSTTSPIVGGWVS